MSSTRRTANTATRSRRKLTDLDVRIKRLLAGAVRSAPELEQKFGPQAFALWEADVMAFDPEIEQHLVREAKLQAEYSELTAAAQARSSAAQKYNLSGIVKFREDADRQTRHDAEQVRWQWYADNRPAARPDLTTTWCELRHDMARKLGYRGLHRAWATSG